MKTIYSAEHTRHHGKGELIDGLVQPCHEQPARAERVLQEVEAQGLGDIVPPRSFGMGRVERVHSREYLAFLRTAWDDWVAARGVPAAQAPDALPLVWPTRTLRQMVPRAIDGRLSYYSLDAGTPITAGTWACLTASVDVVQTAVDLVEAGEPAAFALSRPPGHHAAADLLGGYCYINLAAVAAQQFCDSGAERVAILDIDYHHGNGTQSIFYERGEVLYVSLHADPRDEYPYFAGYADETGAGAGAGANINMPLPLGTGYDRYRAALAEACQAITAFGAQALVVSLGVDTFADDPIAQFALEADDYPRLGAAIAQLAVPAVFVLEGGYDLATVGRNVLGVLTGFEHACGG